MNRNFYRHVALLVSGSALSQAIALGAMPVLTRIYTPSEFGELAVYMSIGMLLAQLGTLRYEVAIMLTSTERDAREVGELSCLLTSAFSILTLILVLMYNKQLCILVGLPETSKVLYFLPALMMISGIYQVVHFKKSRGKHFKSVAKGQVAQAASSSSLSIGLGFLGSGTMGLVSGQLIGKICGIVALLSKEIFSGTRKKTETRLKSNSFRRKIVFMKRFRHQPIYNLPQALLDHFRMIGVNVLISRIFDTFFLGQFFMAWRLLQVPVQLIGGSMGQVFFQMVGEQNAQARYDATRKFTIEILLVGAPIFAFLYFSAPLLFSIIFGDEWLVAGKAASALCVWAFMNFVTGPLSLALIAAGKQRLLLMFGIVYTILPFPVFFLGKESEFLETLGNLSTIMALFLVVMTLYSLIALKRSAI